MDAPAKDKRKGKPRVSKRLPIRLGTETKMSNGTVVEISESGMRIESQAAFPANAVLTLFVQFPRHSVRLRARIIWSSAVGENGPSIMGLSLTQPDPTLKQAYAEWTAEVKKAVAAEKTGAAAALTAAPGATAQTPAPTPPAPAVPAISAQASEPHPAPKRPEPAGPVHRRLESPQGQAYDALLERQPDGWRLTIVQTPRQIGVGTPDFQSSCPDYDNAEKTLREFVRTH
jgi:hypothetical protein